MKLIPHQTRLKKRKIAILPFTIVVFFLSCQSKKTEVVETLGSQEHDPKNEMRLKHYKIAGQRLYIEHCGKCHQNDGTGLGRLIPPLKDSDYLESDISGMLCIIKNGLEGPIMVNGVEYDHPMPGNRELTALEIAEIATYVSNQWTSRKILIPVKEAEVILENCPKEN